MERFLITSCFLLFLSSCGSFHLAEHHQLDRNEKLLPSLLPVYHHYDRNVEVNNEIYFDEETGFENVSQMMNPYLDPFLEGLFRKEVWGAISKSGSKDYGYAVLSENYLSITNNHSLAALGFVLAFIPNILGLPLNIQEVEIEYVLEIIDANNQLIGRYVGTGYKKKSFGLYNFGKSGNGKLLKLLAYQEAMSTIKGQIIEDYNNLSAKLLKAGTID